MIRKKIKWSLDIIDPIIKRPCDCQCCNGCKRNGVDCNVFGGIVCNQCNEWRCEKCFNNEINKCRNCLKDWN